MNLQIYVPNSCEWRKVLFSCFNMKKHAFKAHGTMSSSFGEDVDSVRYFLGGFITSKTVTLASMTDILVDKRNFPKAQNWMHGLMKTCVEFKKSVMITLKYQDKLVQTSQSHVQDSKRRQLGSCKLKPSDVQFCRIGKENLHGQKWKAVMPCILHEDEIEAIKVAQRAKEHGDTQVRHPHRWPA